MDLERCLNDAVRSTWLNPVRAPGSSGIDCGLKDAQDRACCGDEQRHSSPQYAFGACSLMLVITRSAF